MFQWEAEEARTLGEFKTAYLAGIDKKCLYYITNCTAETSVANPDSLNTDPDTAFQVNPDPDPGY
jgi:hypothetical protein